MRWTRWVVGGASIAALGAALGALSCTGTTAQQGATTEDPVTRGHRLAWTSGCVDCHTPGAFYGAPDTTRMLSGSELGWTGPWGTTYARNLTPDSTGLAAWTEQQIVAAIRTGHRPDGSVILPPMPWQAYSRMTDEDAYALAAYLRSLAPVRHLNPSTLPPGTRPAGPTIAMPPPPVWDAQNLPPPAAAAGGESGTPPGQGSGTH